MNTPLHSRAKRLALFVLLTTQPAFAQFVWNAASDFSITNGNPNGVWSYGWMDTGFNTFTLFTTTGYNSNNTALPMWGQTPEVWLNLSTVPHFSVPVGSLSLHPGEGGLPAIVRWTAPTGVSGTVTINGQFLSGDSGIMQVAVRRGTSVLWSATDAGSFALTALNIAAGDSFDFAVYGGYSSGNTGFNATISAVPESSAYAAIAGVIVLAGAIAYRRLRTPFPAI